jgi:membrane-associated phospholipid phosphatase
MEMRALNASSSLHGVSWLLAIRPSRQIAIMEIRARKVGRMRRNTIGCIALLTLTILTPALRAQVAANPADGEYQRPVSWKQFPPNFLDDQKHIWAFPANLHKKRVWIPTALILGAAAGLILLDPEPASYFRHTTTFHQFNNIFSGTNTAIATAVIPAALYGVGLLDHDSKMTQTALLAGEAAADSAVLVTVLKESSRRIRPENVRPDESFGDSFYEGHGNSFPSGHATLAFSIATVIARRYGNHKWVPYASYGAATLIAFSRVTLSAHYISDVFLGSALGYSVGRFAVLRQ